MFDVKSRGHPTVNHFLPPYYVHSSSSAFHGEISSYIPKGLGTETMIPEGTQGIRKLLTTTESVCKPCFEAFNAGLEPDGVFLSDCCCRSSIPLAPLSRCIASQECPRGDERRLAVLASLYVHIMIRRFVPSLATELHLTIRLLHVHSEVALSGTGAVMKSEQDRLGDPSSSRMNAGSPPTAESRLKEKDGTPELKIVFRTGLDCRSFAASVLLGLKSLLPHIGADTLDLFAGSLALASQVNEGCYPCVPSPATCL